MKNNINISNTIVENLCFSTDRILKFAYDIIIDNHHSNDVNSLITIVSNFNNIRIDIIHITKVMEEMANFNAKIINQNRFKYQLTFSPIFIEYGEDGEIINQIELRITLSIT